MTIVIAAIGSRGDVAPFVGLGAGLQAAGYRVALATQAIFAPMVREAGLEFRLVPGDMRAALGGAEARGLRTQGTTWRGRLGIIKLARRLIDDISTGLRDAAGDADALLLHRSAIVQGYLLGEALGIPAISLELFPSVPSREFGIPALTDRSLGPAGIWLLKRVMPRLPFPFDGSIKRFAREIGVKPRGFGAVRLAMIEDLNHLILHGYSPQIVPRPHDWRPGIEVTGYWWPPAPANWTPPAALVDFLAAGPPPVYLGFGSMLQGEGERFSGIIVEAVLRAKVRAVVQSGWAELNAAGDDVLTIGEAPHEWLFPRMAAVVHHCGAGTTGASLRAGVPVVPVPVLVDQPFWANRLAKLGVATPKLVASKLTAAALAHALTEITTDPRYRERAAAVGDRVREEDGVGRVAGYLARKLDAAGPGLAPPRVA